MKKTPGMIALFCSMVMVLGCSSADKARPPEKRITVSALSELLQGKHPPRIFYTGSLLQWRDEHIPSSRFIPCDTPEEAVNPLLQDRDTPLVLYGMEPLTREACPLVARLAREGSPSFFVLSGGLAVWKKNGLATVSTERIPRLAVPGISPKEVRGYAVEGKKPLILDIRAAAAFQAHPVNGALNIPLTQLHERYGDIPLDRPVVVVDKEGGETLLAASYLLRKGVLVAARLPGGIKDLPANTTEGGDRR